jgi:hypothetical protein
LKRPGWLTDIHLNFVESHDLDGLCRDIREENLDTVLLGGDIVRHPTSRMTCSGTTTGSTCRSTSS